VGSTSGKLAGSLVFLVALILLPCLCVASEKYKFVLKLGKGVPVCEAYLKRLNKSDFESPPYCDRPENTDVPGFAELNRVFLNADEILKLDRQAYGFLMNRDVHYWEKSLAERKRLGLSITTDAQLRSEIVLQLRSSAEVQRHFRFEPPVDVDNDGVRDLLVVWRETGYVCGEPFGNFTRPVRGATHVLVLDKEGNVDPARTQEIFGHPEGGYIVQIKDRTGGAVTTETKRFRPVGPTLGVIVFRDKTYFDTFYDEWGDLKNQRKDDPQIYNTLALLKHERGKTEAICELLWREPKER